MRPVRICEFIDIDFIPCNNACEGNTTYCGTHNHMLRKAERDAKKTKIVKPVKKVTEKRAKQNREYLEMREQFLEQYPVCQVKDCQAKATEVHHPQGRANDLLTNPENFFAICSEHHIYYTKHSKEAIENNYSKLRST